MRSYPWLLRCRKVSNLPLRFTASLGILALPESNSAKGNYTGRVENFVSLTDLPKCSKHSVDEGVDLLRTPARTNNPRCQVAVN